MNPRYTAQKREGIGGPPIPGDEPFMLIRAQDVLALEMMEYYRNRYISLPRAMQDPQVLVELDQHHQSISMWQEAHPPKVADR
jgi:hypothetical protein